VAGLDAKSILAAIGARYDFGRLPTLTTREEMAKIGLPFGVGRFDIGEAKVGVSDFIIYNDGLAAVAEKTEWAEDFLEDLVPWITREFNFRSITTSIRHLYSSTVIVDFERPLSRLVSGYEKLSELISSRTVSAMRAQGPMQFARLDFEVDKTTMVGDIPSPKFVLERRSGVEFGRERYYSQAAMQTSAHIEVLTEIEKIAGQNR